MSSCERQSSVSECCGARLCEVCLSSASCTGSQHTETKTAHITPSDVQQRKACGVWLATLQALPLPGRSQGCRCGWPGASACGTLLPRNQTRLRSWWAWCRCGLGCPSLAPGQVLGCQQVKSAAALSGIAGAVPTHAATTRHCLA